MRRALFVALVASALVAPMSCDGDSADGPAAVDAHDATPTDRGGDAHAAAPVDGAARIGLCAPTCGARVCGDDGCGGSCGACEGGQECSSEGQCAAVPCVPACADRACGPDGCAGSCGTCIDGQECSADGHCATSGCVPACGGKSCGADGCGASCGTCDDGEMCSEDGQCAPPPCAPACDGKACGADGCGGSCGVCAGGQECSAEGECATVACVPACAGKDCGDDGCGGSCGGCDDADPCTVDVCDEGAGLCSYPLIAACLPGMVDVPAGAFWMGCNAVLDQACQVDEAVQHLVNLSAYRIDVTEVTVGEYAHCVATGGCEPPIGGANACYYGQDGMDHRPVSCVSWPQAADYCAWADRRLCTEAEWEKAARGGCETLPDADCAAGMPVYPWGAETATCDYAVMDDGGLGCGTKSTWDVGSKPAGVSPYGALDMAGNVWEWVGDWYGVDFYGVSPAQDPTGPPTGTVRVARGGAYKNDATWVRSSDRDYSPPGAGALAVGFRCCRSLP